MRVVEQGRLTLDQLGHHSPPAPHKNLLLPSPKLVFAIKTVLVGNYQDAHVQGCVDSVKCQNAHILFYLGFPNSSIAASLPNYQSEPKLSWKKSKRWPITISSQLNWSNLGHKHGSLADNQQTSNLGLLNTGIYSEWYKTTIDANTRKKREAWSQTFKLNATSHQGTWTKKKR